MSNNETVAEREAAYHRRYNRVGDHLRETAYKLKAGLLPVDVSGLLVAVGIEFHREHSPDDDVVKWLRELADALESGEIGIRPQKAKLN